MKMLGDPPPLIVKEKVWRLGQEAHRQSALRIRRKLSHNSAPEALLLEATESVRQSWGAFPSDYLEETNDPFPDEDKNMITEREMREMAHKIYEELSETEAFMWGLGIVGIFHQWERSTRRAVSDLTARPKLLDKTMKFSELCAEVTKRGFPIDMSSNFVQLRTASLIANTIKHGEGTSFRELVATRRDLFTGGPVGVRMGNIDPKPEHLRVGQINFDEAEYAVDQLWSEVGAAIRRK
jgi:hypothetical protein